MLDDEILAFRPDSPEDTEFIEKFISVALPVKVTPSVDVKPIKVERCGKPIITTGKQPRCDMGNKGGECEFTIIQKMKIEIPVRFKVKPEIDDPYVDCEVRSDRDCKKDEK